MRVDFTNEFISCDCKQYNYSYLLCKRPTPLVNRKEVNEGFYQAYMSLVITKALRMGGKPKNREVFHSEFHRYFLLRKACHLVFPQAFLSYCTKHLILSGGFKKGTLLQKELHCRDF